MIRFVDSAFIICKVPKFSGGAFLQRFFSTFPAGLPGLGLLLLRATLGITAIVQGATVLSKQTDSSVMILLIGISLIACGGLILIGFLTPFVGGFLFLESLTGAVFSFSEFLQIFDLHAVYLIILSAAIALLGPGAFSVDAILFGRREIIIPKN